MFEGLNGTNMLPGVIPSAFGQSHTSKEEGCPEKIESKEIIFFNYIGSNYGLTAKIEEDKLRVIASGGNINRRDGTRFQINLLSDDLSLLEELQTIIEENDVVRNNGYCHYVDGLPGGIGDSIDVKYESGEKLYKTSNQTPVVGSEVGQKFYNVFLDYVRRHGLDFTTKGSNVQLYDDADEEYVQGTWNGEHFGEKISVTFEGKRVKITVDEKLVEDTEYTIFEGSIVKNQLKEGVEKPTSYGDYELLKGVSMLNKKNWFTMTGYFLGDSYSTADFHNFDKKKPENEK